MKQIQKEDYQLWLGHPVTQALRDYLKADRATLKEQWAEGALVCDTEFQTAVQSARYFGRLELAQLILDLDETQLNETEQSDGS